MTTRRVFCFGISGGLALVTVGAIFDASGPDGSGGGNRGGAFGTWKALADSFGGTTSICPAHVGITGEMSMCVWK